MFVICRILYNADLLKYRAVAKDKYRVYKKNVPIPKSLLNWIFCKIMDSNSNQRLIWDFRFASKSILFSYVSFCKQGGELKMLNFQVACAQKFQAKNEFFLHCQQIWNVVINCKNFIKNDTW